MKEEERAQPVNELNIELTEEIAEGNYANLAIISHSSAEFILDFIRILPGVAKAKVKSRIIMTPQHAKRLLLAMQDNIQKYEMNYGAIELKELEPPMHPLNFGGPAGVA